MVNFYRFATLTRLTSGAVSLRYRPLPYAEEHDSVSALFLVVSSLRELNTPVGISFENREHIYEAFKVFKREDIRERTYRKALLERLWSVAERNTLPPDLGDRRKAIVFGLHCVL